MDAPRVSVLIGCWNNAPTLPRAIDSILEQTLEDFELIVVDDGSTDETPDLVDRYSDPRVRRLALEHMGIARSLNAGMQQARAEAVALQDADDWSLPQRLERQLAVLDARPEVAVVGCWMKEVDEDGRALRRTRQPRAAGDVGRVLPRFNPIPGTAAMMRRSAALAVGGFDPEIRFTQDYDLWSRLSDEHVVFCLDEVLAVRQMWMSAHGQRNERKQIAEALRIRLDLIRRRGELSASRYLVRPAVSWATPRGVKGMVRRSRGMAP